MPLVVEAFETAAETAAEAAETAETETAETVTYVTSARVNPYQTNNTNSSAIVYYYSPRTIHWDYTFLRHPDYYFCWTFYFGGCVDDYSSSSSSFFECQILLVNVVLVLVLVLVMPLALYSFHWFDYMLLWWC